MDKYILDIVVNLFSDKCNYSANFLLSDSKVFRFNATLNCGGTLYMLKSIVANFVYHEFLHAYEKTKWSENNKLAKFEKKYGERSVYFLIKDLNNNNKIGKDIRDYCTDIFKILYFCSPIKQNAYVSQGISNIEYSQGKDMKDYFLDDYWNTIIRCVFHLHNLKDKLLQEKILGKVKELIGAFYKLPKDYDIFVKYLYRLVDYKYKIFCVKINRNLADRGIDRMIPSI